MHAGPFRCILFDSAGLVPTHVISTHGKIADVDELVEAAVVLVIDYFTKAVEFYVHYSSNRWL